MRNSKNRKKLRRTRTVSLLAAAFVFIALIFCCSLFCRQCTCGPQSHSDIIDTSEFVDVNTKNNIDLVKWAEGAYNNGWGYVYGTWGNRLTDDLLRTKLAQYPIDAGENEQFIRRNWMGRRVTDCVGLIKGYSWYTPGSGFIYCSNGMPDIGANRMYDEAVSKGEISSIPEIPGLAVWTQGHIGVYIGDGWVIEAMSTVDGVKKTRLADRPWTHWLEIPYIEYI